MLATRAHHELDHLAGRHRVERFWAAAPDRLSGRRRSVAVLAQRLVGWSRFLVAVVRRPRTVRLWDVVHLHAADRWFELPFVLALRVSGVTVVLTSHNVVPHDSGRLARWKMRLLYRSVHGVITHTPEASTAVSALAGRSIATCVIPHPTYRPLVEGCDAGRPSATSQPIVDEPRDGHAAARRLTVAHLGTIRPYKGFDVVAGAVALVRQRWPELEFVVVGKPSSDVDVADVLSGLPPEAVRATLGHVPLCDLVAAAQEADVVVLGHRSTSASGIALLALGASTPVVAPDAVPLSRLLQSERSWLYEPGSVDAAAIALGGVLAEVVEDRAAVRARARVLDDAVPSWSVAAAELLVFARTLQDAR